MNKKAAFNQMRTKLFNSCEVKTTGRKQRSKDLLRILVQQESFIEKNNKFTNIDILSLDKIMGHVQRYSFIPEHETDSKFDYDYKDIEESGFMRGGRVFNRPSGWKKIALKISGKYGDDTWFGVGVGKRGKDEKQSLDGEWPISYHGPKNHNTIASIIENGYDINKNTRSQYGKGIYSSPDIPIPESFAETFVHEGKRIKAMIMNRVHMSCTKVEKDGTIYVTTNDSMIRPIAILIKEV